MLSVTIEERRGEVLRLGQHRRARRSCQYGRHFLYYFLESHPQDFRRDRIKRRHVRARFGAHTLSTSTRRLLYSSKWQRIPGRSSTVVSIPSTIAGPSKATPV